MKKGLILFCFIFGIVSMLFAQGSMYEEPGNNITNGKTTVSIANTAVALASSETKILSVNISWLPDNSKDRIYVGTSSVNVNNGIQITSGSILRLEINDLNKVYINSDIAGDGVSWVAVLR